jgi:phenylalanyl-tRNA synthetase alpha chain
VSIKDDLQILHKEGQDAILRAASLEVIEEIRVKFLGRKGKLTLVLKGLKNIPPSDRPKIGKLANEIREALENELEKKKEELDRKAEEKKLKKEIIDITLPGKIPHIGRKHLLTQVVEEITNIFLGLGYNVAEGPEVELDYYNFEALNTPPDHPARSLQDTFYVKTTTEYGSFDYAQDRQATGEKEVLLRTHTSPVQIRVMEKTKPPIYIIAPGKAYRRDVADPTHSPMFHQVEGLVVDKHLTFGDLKGTLEVFARAIFGEDRRVRLRPHFFPFTEPSAEVDVSCIICDGKGCRVCKWTGWIEILGAGMVDPNVFKAVAYDPEKITGFAFGMGIERIAMLKYGVSDMRLFFENDLRLLAQF